MKNIKLLFLFCLVQIFYTSAQTNPEQQPFLFKTKQLLAALDYLGAPILPGDKKSIEDFISDRDTESTMENLQGILDKYALFNVDINPESRVKVTPGLAQPILDQNGWKTFLVKVDNQAGITAVLNVASEQAKRDYDGGEKIYGFGNPGNSKPVSQKDIADRWMDLGLYTQAPMQPRLSGLQTEYFIIQLYSRDAGKRAARFSFSCGQATQDIGLRDAADILFHCLPSQKIRLQVLDEKQRPTTASFIIKDKQQHIYPSQAKRLAPDFFFQQQVYRANGETLDLPVGDYTIEYGRGPEYLTGTFDLHVSSKKDQTVKIKLQRWFDPASYQWYSGDHHIHAAGCSHYTTPTQGVNPADMMRHIVGEAVNVGSVLTWGPGYYHQKQFFEGGDNKLSTAQHIMRYDLEISGFPSSHAGHLVLLRLKDQDYPGTKVLEDWPTWTIPILRWAKAQGAVTGYAHSGLGLAVTTDHLPNYEMPSFDGIGANEYIVAVTQDLVDFISTMDTPPTWELNIWYHTLNCGFRTRISGETDFPCMSDEKVAHGRSYVKLDSNLDFNEWVQGIKKGRTYTSDGKSHILDFKINNTEFGTKDSEVNLQQPGLVTVTAKVAAYLEETIDTSIHPLNLKDNIWLQKPFWSIEKGRVGKTRNLLVELIVNGKVAATKTIVANGSIQDISFDIRIGKSSWVALRIMPSAHTNPIFVLIDHKPIRASRLSAEWCSKAVDQCWSQKSMKFAANEKIEAKRIYEAAKSTYEKIARESEND